MASAHFPYRKVAPHGLTAVVPFLSLGEPAEAAISGCDDRRVGGHPLHMPPQLYSCGFLRRWVKNSPVQLLLAFLVHEEAADEDGKHDGCEHEQCAVHGLLLPFIP